MSFDFNTKDQLFSRYPNPYKTENWFLLGVSLLNLAGVIVLFLNARAYLRNGEHMLFGMCMVLTVLFLFVLGRTAIRLLTQLRFVFGRGYPAGLAPELNAGVIGHSKQADQLIELMRHQTIPFSEPQGPVEGLLFALFRSLLVAPGAVREQAKQHFESLLIHGALLLSLLSSWLLFSGSDQEGVVSVLYLPLTGLSLLTVLQRRYAAQQQTSAFPFMLRLIGLIGFAILGPVLVPRVLPHADLTPMWTPPLILLTGTLLNAGLALYALVAQLDIPASTSVACEETRLTMNAAPGQLWTEINQLFKENWFEGIPNRAYANITPEIAGEIRGRFQGYILEETQPEPVHPSGNGEPGRLLQTRFGPALLALNGLAVLAAFSAFLSAAILSSSLADFKPAGVYNFVLCLLALQMLTLHALRSGHLLWSRMYFRSTLIWIETQGTYQTADFQVGNQMNSHFSSRSSVTRTEDAILRVWMADLYTVCFGKENQRYLVSLAPSLVKPAWYLRRLEEFARNQSSVAAPVSARDLEHTRTMSGFEALAKQTPDQQSLQQNQIAQPEQRPLPSIGHGRIKLIQQDRGFGFIQQQGGPDMYFRVQHLETQDLQAGAEVRFEIVSTQRGSEARKIRALNEQ